MTAMNDGGGRLEARSKACDREMPERRSISLGFPYLQIEKGRARLLAVMMPRQYARRCSLVLETMSHPLHTTAWCSRTHSCWSMNGALI